MPLINCLMSSSQTDPSTVGKCLTDLDIESTNSDTISNCASSLDGENLLHHEGVLTQSLDPPLTSVPWILYNDVIAYMLHYFL